MTAHEMNLHTLFGIDINQYYAMEFLKMLDERLHYKQLPKGFEWMNYFEECYTNKKLTERNVLNLANILANTDSLAIYPVYCFSSESVAFEVADTTTKKPLLRFTESQLPKNHGFETLSQYFMREKNLRLSEKIGIMIVNRRNYYDNCETDLSIFEGDIRPDNYIDEAMERRLSSTK